MKLEYLRNRLKAKGLKITPQRLIILEAVGKLNNHPTAEQILEYIRKQHPNIATATVYKVLDALVSKEVIQKVETKRDIMRYDAIIESHHHLYCSETERIEDYNDKELNELLIKHFESKGISNFIIEDVKLQIIGKFTENKNIHKS
jgi:Fur family transcriptional regulator, peroxide stress response regulator